MRAYMAAELPRLLTMRLTESVMTIAKQMADDMLSFYNGDQPGGTPGLLPDPYYCTSFHVPVELCTS